MYTNNELLFPNYLIPMVRDMRGAEWRALVDRVIELPERDPEVVAFSMMMVRLNGCMECETDSYRAMRGCGMCVAQTLRRYKGSDDDLLAIYNKALVDVMKFMEEKAEKIRKIA